MCSIVHNDVPESSINKDMHCKRTGQMGAKKYLRKSCYHRIECSIANSLATFMWRRPLNSAALVAPTHKGPVGVRWDKYSSSGLDDQQVEGQDYSKGDI